MKRITILIIILFAIIACNNKNDQKSDNPTEKKFYLGADLSYVNEMEDCSGYYREYGTNVDPYELFSRKGANIVRLRLWNNPEWTNYSNFQDVRKSIQRAKDANMEVLLDFHYSDTWADPQKQIIPKAWENITDLEILGDSLYNFTYTTLSKLAVLGLCPEMVQVGNEINIEILQQIEEMNLETINWDRNIYLLNRGIQAVRDVSDINECNIEVMLHIAQPENADWWFEKAFSKGILDFEWIGLSYYPKWSSLNLTQVPGAIRNTKQKFNKKIMIVEVAYPHTMYNADPAHNILGEDALHNPYPATPQGQLDFLTDLTQLTAQQGCEGVIYWEPAWISNSCSTPWGQGSHWDNATFFDAQNNNEALKTFDFFKVIINESSTK